MSAQESLFTIFFAAFTGWISIWIVVKILFYPRKEINILGLKIQGMISRKYPLIIASLGEFVSAELFSFEGIEKRISDPENFQKLQPEIAAHVDHFLRNKLKEVFPMLASLMGEKTIMQLKEAFLIELESLFPAVMASYMEKLRQDLDIEKIIKEKIAALSLQKLEGIISKSLKREFNVLKIAGAVIGLMTGLLQVLLLFLFR